MLTVGQGSRRGGYEGAGMKGRVWESENGREASSLKCRQYPLSDALHLVNPPHPIAFISAIGRFPIPLCYERETSHIWEF